MLINPFTPSEIASQPDDFFGRRLELQELERSLMQGSVAIQGAIGIGKSSLLARVRLTMEGFGSTCNSISAVSTGHKDIKDIDEAARLVLESFADVDETSNKIKLSIGKILEIESAEVCRYFVKGRHLAGLIKFMDKVNMDMILSDQQYLILAIDEADKCPIPLARFIRALTTHIQQLGIKRVRFVLAGVNPYFQKMVDEDPGINRFFYKKMTLSPMEQSDAYELLETKFHHVKEASEQNGIELSIDPTVIDRIVNLSGGHPHILQLMGSFVVENENQDSDGVIDSRNLANSLITICYEDRSHAYKSIIHFLEVHNRYDKLMQLFEVASSSFPTRIDRQFALSATDEETLEWFVDHNLLTILPDDYYGLTDEFLRIRMIMDEELQNQPDIEKGLIGEGAIRKLPYRQFDDDYRDEYVPAYGFEDELVEDDEFGKGE